MPDRRSIFRLLALAGFLLTVALALWLAELRPLFVVIVMALALLLAWAVEWLSWRQELVPVVQAAEAEPEEADVVPDVVEEPLEPEPVVVAAVAEEVVEPVEAAPPPVGPPVLEPEPEPGPEPIPVAEEPLAAAPEPPEPPPVVVPVEPAAAPPPEPVRAAPEPPREEPAPRPPLRPVPPPEPVEPPAAPPPPPPPVREPAPAAAARSEVIDMRTRATAQPRRWNLWDLETRAREHAQVDPNRYEEWSYLFVHLRQFATPDGSLPIEFDGLIRESFGDLLERAG